MATVNTTPPPPPPPPSSSSRRHAAERDRVAAEPHVPQPRATTPPAAPPPPPPPPSHGAATWDLPAALAAEAAERSLAAASAPPPGALPPYPLPPRERAALVNWVIQTNAEHPSFRYAPETVYCAIAYLDKTLPHLIPTPAPAADELVQLPTPAGGASPALAPALAVGAACLWLAAKCCEDRRAPRVRALAALVAHARSYVTAVAAKKPGGRDSGVAVAGSASATDVAGRAAAAADTPDAAAVAAAARDVRLAERHVLAALRFQLYVEPPSARAFAVLAGDPRLVGDALASARAGPAAAGVADVTPPPSPSAPAPMPSPGATAASPPPSADASPLTPLTGRRASVSVLPPPAPAVQPVPAALRDERWPAHLAGGAARDVAVRALRAVQVALVQDVLPAGREATLTHPGELARRMLVKALPEAAAAAVEAAASGSSRRRGA